jgi:DNA-binding winged helix-turn-helix (wHTH) protein/cytochrome c-type biogenesis protein CcmH/NrfG
MDRQQTRPSPVTFDRYVFDPDRRSLLRSGKPVVLLGKAFDLLTILVASRGVPVSREELYERLWPVGVVEDGNLTQSVHLLRRTLDPGGNGRAFIETLPRYGYRFSKPTHDFRQRPLRISRLSRLILWGGAPAVVAAVLLLAGSAVQSTSAPLSPQASVAYALGLYHLNMRTMGDLRHSAAYFTQTVRDAPQSALGYAGLASAYALEAEFEKVGSPAFKSDVMFAKRNRDQALAHDEANTEAHAAAAFLAYRFDGNLALANREFQLAFAADPQNATAHHWHAVLLFSQGAIDSALSEWELAHQLDPTSEVISRWLGRAYYYQRRPADAIRTLSETVAIEPFDAPAWLTLASAQEQGGNLRDALRSLETVRRRMPEEDTYVIPDEARVRLLLRHGEGDPRTNEQINRLASDGRLDAEEVALFYLALGSRDHRVTKCTPTVADRCLLGKIRPAL